MASFGIENEKRIVVGAHYDVCKDQPGADDNGSGVAGLLELARLLQNADLKYRIDLVAYTLEEPPYFRTENMGSYIHAQGLKTENIDVYGMISMEMIGYFSSTKGSQRYPAKFLKLFYGSRGDYITLVNKFGAGKFTRRFGRKFRSAADIWVKTFKGPRNLPGIDFSDHLNYWDQGYSALMITDTAFYRNSNYHKKTDTLDTLNVESMAKVVDAIHHGLTSIR